MGNAGRFKTGARPRTTAPRPGATDMSDTNQSPPRQTESATAQGTEYACDNPGLTGKQFLYAVMRDRTLPLRTRIRAAGKLMHIEPDGPPKARCTIVIEGFPSDAVHTRTPESQSFSPSRSYSSHAQSETPGPTNIDEIISDIKSGNYPQPTLCTVCGHYMPYPCSTTPLQ
jgi:hypothetical protein